MHSLYFLLCKLISPDYILSDRFKLGGAVVSALAAMAMLSARTLVRVPPTTSGVFRL